MDTLYDKLLNNQIWNDTHEFHYGEVDEIEHQRIYAKKIYDEAVDILNSLNYKKWLSNDNKLLNEYAIRTILREYILENKLAHTVIDAEDIIKNPKLIKKYKLELWDYPGLAESLEFQRNYITMCMTSPDELSRNIIEKINFKDIMDIVMDPVWESGMTRQAFELSVLRVLSYYLHLELDYFDTEIKKHFMRLFEEKPSWSGILKKLLEENIRFRECMLKEPEWLIKMVEKHTLCETLLRTFSNIPKTILSAYYDIFLSKIHRLNLAKMRSYNPEGCQSFFLAVAKEPKLLDSENNKRQIYADGCFEEGMMYFDINTNHVNAFRLKDLPLEDALMLYLESERTGIKNMVWVASVQTTKRYIGVKEKTLQQLKDQLDMRLSAAIGCDIHTWIKMQQPLVESLGASRSEQEEWYERSFMDTVQKREGHSEIPLIV